MNELTDKVASILVMLRAESIADLAASRQAMFKHDMMFLGEKGNTIYSTDLWCALNEQFGVAISLDDLHSLIPTICAALKMKCTPMVELSNVGKPDAPISQYSIELF